jgi:two-component system sensor histidine kinase BarA
MCVSSYIPASCASTEYFLYASQKLPEFFYGKKHVLLVEDNPLLQYLHSLWLEQLGYEVTVVDSGEAALEKSLSDYNAVLMDLDLPGIDGVTTTQQLFCNNPTLNIPVIACSTHPASEMKKACIAAGMSDYCQKPVSPALLSQTLTTYIVN